MAASIRITINEDLERVLESLKGQYPTLDYPELFKLGLAELYHKRELEARERWAASLNELDIREEEASSIADARKEPSSKAMSLAALKKDLKTKR
jgi:hypothetical protein